MAEFFHDGQRIAYDVAGSGPPVVLLHGFPQTRALWRRVAADLSRDWRLVMPDLRGYGGSDAPMPLADLSNYTFRVMAADVLALMRHLGHETFHLVGHDRGGRVAYRLALDAPGAVRSLTVMDIVPTAHLLRNWTVEVGRDYFHWTYLAQPAPFAETMIAADPDAFFEACLTGWGGAQVADFPEIDAYRAAWRRPEIIAGMCADYRAALGPDRSDDAADAGRRVTAPALVVWGRDGVMARHFDVAATWAEYLSDVCTGTAPGGHFFVDTAPGETTVLLRDFLGRQERGA